MWTSVLLLAYALAVGTVGAMVLRRAAWTSQAPRLAVAAWHVLSLSVLGAIALAGLLMLNPGPHTEMGSLSWSTHMLVAGNFSQVAPTLWCVLFVAFAVVTLLRTSLWLARSLLGSRRERAAHLQQLSFLGSHDPTRDALVVDNPLAVAYCLPGPRPAVVLTTGALSALDGDELEAVLEHERAHLRGRHDLILATSRGLERAWRHVPVFRWAHQEQKRLLEMVADDAAARHGTRRTVATAMVRMAESGVPAAALGAGGSHVVARVDRMLQPRRPIGRLATVAVVSALALVAVLPVLVAVVPLVTSTGLQACGIAGTAG